MDEKMKGIIHVRIDDRMIHGQSSNTMDKSIEC